jgi:hypothetical protein
MEAYRLHRDKKGEPFFGAPITDDRMIKATRDNAKIYTHANRWSDVDHIFISLEEKKKKQITVLGAFVWRQMVEDFDEFAHELRVHDFTSIHRELPIVSDVEMWVKFNTVDLEDFPPQRA